MPRKIIEQAIDNAKAETEPIAKPKRTLKKPPQEPGKVINVEPMPEPAAIKEPRVYTKGEKYEEGEVVLIPRRKRVTRIDEATGKMKKEITDTGKMQRAVIQTVKIPRFI
jgi:hypothetical protein